MMNILSILSEGIRTIPFIDCIVMISQQRMDTDSDLIRQRGLRVDRRVSSRNIPKWDRTYPTIHEIITNSSSSSSSIDQEPSPIWVSSPNATRPCSTLSTSPGTNTSHTRMTVRNTIWNIRIFRYEDWATTVGGLPATFLICWITYQSKLVLEIYSVSWQLLVIFFPLFLLDFRFSGF